MPRDLLRRMLLISDVPGGDPMDIAAVAGHATTNLGDAIEGEARW